MRVGSLFSGIGGFDIAAEAMGWRTSWFVEWNPHCRHWLAEHFPGRPIYGDITQVDFQTVEPIDVLCGGFPCQPASAAGNRKGVNDDRWLWPEFARAVRVLRPRYVVVENVPGLASVNDGRAMGEVLGDLAALFYDAVGYRLSAADVGAPHERERICVVAYPASTRPAGRKDAGAGASDAREDGRGRVEPERISRGVGDPMRGGFVRDVGREPDEVAAHGHEELGDPDGRRREQRDAGIGHGAIAHARHVSVVDTASGRRRTGEGVEVRRTTGERARVGDSDRAGFGQQCGAVAVRPEFGSAECGSGEVCDWRDAVRCAGADGSVRIIPAEAAHTGPQSTLWPVADGLPGRVARLAAVGNAVVPAWAVEAFRVIHAMETAQ